MALSRPPNHLRKLAALDILFLGYRIIVIEFACGVLLSAGLGIFVLVRAHSFWQFAFGAYLVCLGINYIPLLLYCIDIGNRANASAEIGGELKDRKAVMAKYRKVSLLLLVPLATVLIALRHKRGASRVEATR